MHIRRWLAAFVLGLGFAPLTALAGDCGADQPCTHQPPAPRFCTCPLCCPGPACYPPAYHQHPRPRKHHHFGPPAPPVAPVMQTVLTQAAAVVAQPAIPVQPAILTQPNIAAMQQFAAMMAQQQKAQAEAQSDKSCGQSKVLSGESTDELKQLLQLFRESLSQSSAGTAAAAANVSPPAPLPMNSQRLEQLVQSLAEVVQQRQGPANSAPASQTAATQPSATDARIKQLADQVEAMQQMLELLVQEREQAVRGQPRN